MTIPAEAPPEKFVPVISKATAPFRMAAGIANDGRTPTVSLLASNSPIDKHVRIAKLKITKDWNPRGQTRPVWVSVSSARAGPKQTFATVGSTRRRFCPKKGKLASYDYGQDQLRNFGNYECLKNF